LNTASARLLAPRVAMAAVVWALIVAGFGMPGAQT
jgi:hypothetical protein